MTATTNLYAPNVLLEWACSFLQTSSQTNLKDETIFHLRSRLEYHL